MTLPCRLVNILVAAGGLLIAAPLLAIFSLAIKCEDGGPVFYSQWRIGRSLRPFRLWKLRSMVVGADRMGLLTAARDCRVTRCGRFARKYKLDELPQLWNVLKGEMQLVGPRPEVEAYVQLFQEEYSKLLCDPPGVTDPASIVYRNESSLFSAKNVQQYYVSDVLPNKLRLSLEYQRRRNLLSDAGVVFKTLLVVVF